MCCPVHAVAEREERVRGQARPLRPLPCPTSRDIDRSQAVHLAGPDADGRPVVRQDDRVRLHPGRHRPGEQEIVPLVLRRLDPRHHFHVRPALYDGVHVLHEGSPLDEPNVKTPRRGEGRANHSEVRLSRIGRQGARGEPRGDHHLGEHTGHGTGSVFVRFRVEGDDPPERRHAVAVERPLVRGCRTVRQRDATRVVMLHDHGGRLVEHRDERPGGLRVKPVVERHLLPLQDFRAAQG